MLYVHHNEFFCAEQASDEKVLVAAADQHFEELWSEVCERGHTCARRGCQNPAVSEVWV